MSTCEHGLDDNKTWRWSIAGLWVMTIFVAIFYTHEITVASFEARQARANKLLQNCNKVIANGN